MAMKALILDLDNTLYSWMEAYTPSFLAQVGYLAERTQINEKIIKDNFRSVFKKYGSVEIPSAVYELKIWEDINISSELLKDILSNSQKIFFDKFQQSICLFPNVKDTLDWAKNNSILIFGFSDAFSFWINYRLQCLSIERYFETVFAIDDGIIMHSELVKKYIRSSNIISIPIQYTKPNTFVIDRIINEYGIERENIYMIGDSIEKDILMAKNANIKDIWAEYGTKYQRGYGSVLRSITPWSRTKQKKEGVFQKKIESTYIISDFAEIKDIIS